MGSFEQMTAYFALALQLNSVEDYEHDRILGRFTAVEKVGDTNLLIVQKYEDYVPDILILVLKTFSFCRTKIQFSYPFLKAL